MKILRQLTFAALLLAVGLMIVAGGILIVDSFIPKSKDTLFNSLVFEGGLGLLFSIAGILGWKYMSKKRAKIGENG